MSYTVPMPEGLTSAQKEQAAFAASVRYMGRQDFDRLVMRLLEHTRGMTSRQAYRVVRFSLPWAGIQGYWPTRAIFRHVGAMT